MYSLMPRVWLYVFGVSAFAAIASADPPPQQKTLENLKAPPASSAKLWLGTERIVDLTHSFDGGTIYWPTEAGFRLIRGPAGVTERGYYYAANLSEIPTAGATVIALPMKIGGGSGAPLRIIAMVPD